MLAWITANINIILILLSPLISSLIVWAVRTHFKLKGLVKDNVSLKKDLKEKTEEMHNEFDYKIGQTNSKIEQADIKMDALIDGLREDLKCVKQENEHVSNQIREDIKGVQHNIESLTLQVTKLVGYLEGKKIIES